MISVRNVEEALHQGLKYIYANGVREESRAGPVLVSPTPVTTVYSRPQERVLFSPERDANPFLHLFESLWLLAGRNDAKWLDQFVHDFSSRFAESDGTLHGSYGYRWRHHFDLEGGGATYLPDQLNTVVEMLRNNNQDRRAVIQMWDPVADLGATKKDVPCNLLVMLRVRKSEAKGFASHPEWIHGPQDAHYVLDITVCCRSNDLVWGAYGSNYVQFGVLQEYLAARIGVGIGTYTQVSHNYHAYQNVLDQLEGKAILEGGCKQVYETDGVEATPIVTVPTEFDNDLERFMYRTASSITPYFDKYEYRNCFFHEVAEPLFWANRHWKQKGRQKALQELARMPPRSDWWIAAYQWFQRRATKV